MFCSIPSALFLNRCCLPCMQHQQTTKLSYSQPQIKHSFICRWHLSIHSFIYSRHIDKFNAEQIYFIIIGTFRKRRKQFRFFPISILSHSITPSHTVRNLVVKFDSNLNFRRLISPTSRCYFNHICELRRIRRYITLSVAITIAKSFIISSFDYCTSLLYNVASKDILKLQCIQD